MLTRWTQTIGLAVVCTVFLVGTSCTTTDSPTGPSNTPTPTLTPTPTPTPAAVGNVQITLNPNPVPFSGEAITDVASCANSKNTWFYDQILQETGGLGVTFTSRIDKFDGRIVNSLTSISVVVPASSATTIRSRWCSSQGVAHTAQTTFSGADANGNSITVEGPVANLRSP